MYNEEIYTNVLDSLNILFRTDSNTDVEVKQLVLEQWGKWTLHDIYTYYVVEEEIDYKNENHLEIQTGNFEF